MNTNPTTGTEAFMRMQKLSLHHWLLANDGDYAFECAVMGSDVTLGKYSVVELQVRRERLDPSASTSGYATMIDAVKMAPDKWLLKGTGLK